MLMKGLRRNDDAMKNQCWYSKQPSQIFPGSNIAATAKHLYVFIYILFFASGFIFHCFEKCTLIIKALL